MCDCLVTRAHQEKETSHVAPTQKGKRNKADSSGSCSWPFAIPNDFSCVYKSGRSFSPEASAFWQSWQTYSNSELLSESTLLWMTWASRFRVALLHLAQITTLFVFEKVLRRVPTTSSCMTEPCLSILSCNHKTRGNIPRFLKTKSLFKAPDGSLLTRLNILDYGTRLSKMQGH